MIDGYSLWRVTFSYESPSEHVGARERQVYTVVAQQRDEAEQKSFAHFSNTRVYDDLSLHVEDRVRTSVNRIKKRKITLPQLTLPEDRERFLISPRLSGDNSNLEYIVHELKGR